MDWMKYQNKKTFLIKDTHVKKSVLTKSFIREYFYDISRMLKNLNAFIYLIKTIDKFKIIFIWAATRYDLFVWFSSFFCFSDVYLRWKIHPLNSSIITYSLIYVWWFFSFSNGGMFGCLSFHKARLVFENI